MKLKKLFAGVVAAAMMLTMAVPAFAATGASGDAVAPSNNTVTIKKTYTLTTGSGASPAETFQFTVTSLKYEEGAVATTTLPTVTAAAYTDADGASSAGNKKDLIVDFTNVNYQKVGIYYYKLTETNNGKPGVGYADPIAMKVTVGNVDSTGERDGVEIKSVSFAKLNADDSIGEKIKAEDAFKNTYTAQSVTVTKTVKGDMGDHTKPFSFKVVLTPANGKTAADYKGAIVSGNGISGTETWAIDGTTEYTITVNHKTSVVIGNLPAGVTCKITEDFNEADWTTTVNNVDTKEFTTTIADVDVSADYVNTHDGVVDTGVILDNAPYIALLTIVAAGAVFMIIKKRRNYED